MPGRSASRSTKLSRQNEKRERRNERIASRFSSLVRARVVRWISYFQVTVIHHGHPCDIVASPSVYSVTRISNFALGLFPPSAPLEPFRFRPRPPVSPSAAFASLPLCPPLFFSLVERNFLCAYAPLQWHLGKSTTVKSEFLSFPPSLPSLAFAPALLPIRPVP